jgi:transcriptional regulator of heat shock response
MAGLSNGVNMVKNIDHEPRRRAVLAVTINRYIEEALPVASEDIARDFGVSSATIRNIFAELEDSGYITHPYTSGGRIPTNKGYRYYVDFLILETQLLEPEKKRILNEYKKEARRPEDALEQTSEILSDITHYAGIVSFSDRQDSFYYKGVSYILDQPEFRNIDRMRMMVRMLEEKRDLLEIINRDPGDKVRVYIGSELECPGMEDCSLVVSGYSLKNRPSGRIAVLGPARMEYKHTIPALEYISEVLTGVLEGI